MKRNLQILLSASASSILAFSTLAQDTPIPRTDGPSYTRERAANAQRADRLNGAAKASDLLGMEVKNYQDEKLGKVEDLALDVESGRIVQVIISTGGFIGIGNKLTAVPPGALHHDVAQKVLHLDANQEKLKSAPEFEMSKWAESSDSAQMSAVYRHYGQESAFTFLERDATTDKQGQRATDGQSYNRDNQRNADAQRKADGQRNADGQLNTDGQRYSRDNQRNADAQRYSNEGQRTADGSGNTVSTRRADGTWDKDRISAQSGENQFLIPTSRLGQIQKASDIIGTSVKNLQDENLGDVENILVDLSSGRIVAVIISSGGFLGINNELSAVPSSALRFASDRDSLQLDASKEMLSSAPHFNANQWPDYNQPDKARDVYRAYNVQPYFSTDGATDDDNSRRNVRDRDQRTPATWQPDNSERNVRDRNDQTMTPLDQGNSKSDVDTTARIRKEITAADDISVNAQNVKIITQNGRVTLRGPVNTAEEKRLIGAIADRIATSGNVDNQIEVKPTRDNN